MCAKLPCVPNNLLYGSDHAEYTRKSQKTKVNATKAKEACADRNKLYTGKE